MPHNDFYGRNENKNKINEKMFSLGSLWLRFLYDYECNLCLNGSAHANHMRPYWFLLYTFFFIYGIRLPFHWEQYSDFHICEGNTRIICIHFIYFFFFHFLLNDFFCLLFSFDSIRCKHHICNFSFEPFTIAFHFIVVLVQNIEHIKTNE